MVAGSTEPHFCALPPPPRLRDLAAASLFIDFDGTLVDLAPRPDDIRPNQALPALLLELVEALGGRLALVSGRTIADIDRHLGILPIAVAGSHGGELRTAGGGSVEKQTGDMQAAQKAAGSIPAEATAAVQAFTERQEGLLMETKTLGIALHYRGAPALKADVTGFASGMAQQHGLALKHGKMVVEIMPKGIDKGSAVRRLMTLAPFRESTPLFVGDDITDEDGFRAAADFGGLGILVGDLRETAAQARLASVGAVHDWLQAAVA